jgi:hypothetical protein
MVEGFGGVRVRRVCAGYRVAFAIGEDGELFSWGIGWDVSLGHGDKQDQPSPKRVEAVRGVRMRSVGCGQYHAVALTEDGLVYTWGENPRRSTLGNPDTGVHLLPKPVEALRGVRVGSIAAGDQRTYAGQRRAVGVGMRPQGRPSARPCHTEEPSSAHADGVATDIQVDAVACSYAHTLALADDGSVYACGSAPATTSGALGLGSLVSDAGLAVLTAHRIPGLRAACGS